MVVGLTGGIGSGKTLVSKVFNQLGVPIYYSDLRAKELSNTHPEIVTLVKKEFGEDIYVSEKLDRKKVASIVFSDQSKLEKLNAIVHPVVKQDFELWYERYKKSPYIIKEAAIIVESGLANQVDKLILVTAPIEKRIERVIKRDQISEKDVRERMNKQLSDKEKIPYANYIIKNDDTQLVIPQILEIHQSLIKNLKN